MGAFWLAIAAVTAWAGAGLLATDDPWRAAHWCCRCSCQWYQLRGEFFPPRAIEGHALTSRWSGPGPAGRSQVGLFVVGK